MRNLTIATALFAQAFMLDAAEPVNAASSAAQSAIQSGSAALQAGSFKAAIDQFTKGLASKDLDKATAAITLLNRGLAHQRLGEYIEAMADYDRALQNSTLPPATRAVALYNRGLANRKLYRTTLALEDFTNALILNPKFSQAYNSRANVLRELGYYATAIQDYTSAVHYRHPQLHIPLYGQALSHAAMRNLPAAKNSLTRALSIQPDYKPAKNLLARITTVPKKPQIPTTDNTVVAGKIVDQINTGSVTDTTTVVAKNNLPWAPAPPAVTIQTPTRNEPVEQLLPPETSSKTVVAGTTTQSPFPDYVASPTAAQADTVAQNLIPEPKAEDPSLRGSVSPVNNAGDLPTPGLDLRSAQDELAPTADTSGQEIEPTNTQMASLDPAATQRTTEPETQRAPAPMADGYLIQLSAQTDPDMARGLWNKLAEKHPDLLGDLTPYIIKVQIDGKGTIYRVRAGGFGERQDGKQLCKRLKRRRVTCYVTTAN